MDEYKQICLEYYQRRADELQQRWMNAKSEAEATKIALDLEPLMNYLAKSDRLPKGSLKGEA
jgi:hypothetical protein